VALDICENFNWKNHYIRCWAFWYYWKRKAKNPRQRGNSSGSTATYICRQATGRWKNAEVFLSSFCVFFYRHYVVAITTFKKNLLYIWCFVYEEEEKSTDHWLVRERSETKPLKWRSRRRKSWQRAAQRKGFNITGVLLMSLLPPGVADWDLMLRWLNNNSTLALNYLSVLSLITFVLCWNLSNFTYRTCMYLYALFVVVHLFTKNWETRL